MLAKIPKFVYDERVRKTFVFVVSILILSILHFSFPKAYAAISFTLSPNPLCQDKEKYTLTFEGPENTFVLENDYSLGIWKPGTDSNSFSGDGISVDWKKPTNTKTYTSNDITIVGQRATIGQWHYKLWFGKGTFVLEQDPNRLLSSGGYVMYPKEACVLGLPVLEMSSPVQINATVLIKVRNINPDSDYLLWFIDGQIFINGKFPANTIIDEKFIDEKGVEKSIKTASLSVKLDNQPGTKTLCLKHGSTTLGFGKDNCEISIPIEVTIQPPQITPAIVKSSEPGAPLTESTLFKPTPTPPPPPCATLAPDGKCLNVNTAIGLISTEPQGFVKSIFSLVLGLAGGIALILIMVSGYKFMTSGGNPEATKAATEQLTSAIIGLLFIIFSFVILEIIGVDILRIPGFAE